MNVREKIKARLDTLEADLQAGKHLQSDEAKAEIEALIDSASKFYSVLSEGDRDFVNAARHAVGNNMPWK